MFGEQIAPRFARRINMVDDRKIYLFLDFIFPIIQPANIPHRIKDIALPIQKTITPLGPTELRLGFAPKSKKGKLKNEKTAKTISSIGFQQVNPGGGNPNSSTSSQTHSTKESLITNVNRRTIQTTIPIIPPLIYDFILN
ncbi:MAG: hypothetical protein ABIA78_04390 [archaeon]